MLKQILYTACITPFNENGSEIDYQSLENLLRAQAAAGNGIVLLGSTGEGLSLNNQERKQIVKFAMQLKLNTQIVVGVPNHNLHAALEWLQFCNQFPITGYMASTPIYTKPGITGQTQWFNTLLECAAHPLIIYNIPGRAGVKLHAESVKKLAGHPLFLAIKDSSGGVQDTVDYKIAAPKITVYCGDDYLMPATAAEGAVGLISVISNALPQAARQYVETSLNKKPLVDKIWWQMGKALSAASNPIPIKALLKDIGMIAHDTVRLPLSMDDLPSRDLLLSYYKKIKMQSASLSS